VPHCAQCARPDPLSAPLVKRVVAAERLVTKTASQDHRRALHRRVAIETFVPLARLHRAAQPAGARVPEWLMEVHELPKARVAAYAVSTEDPRVLAASQLPTAAAGTFTAKLSAGVELPQSGHWRKQGDTFLLFTNACAHGGAPVLQFCRRGVKPSRVFVP